MALCPFPATPRVRTTRSTTRARRERSCWAARSSQPSTRGQFGVQPQRSETEAALQIQGEGLGVDDAVTEITGPEKLVGRGLQLAEKRSITRQPRR